MNASHKGRSKDDQRKNGNKPHHVPLIHSSMKGNSETRPPFGQICPKVRQLPLIFERKPTGKATRTDQTKRGRSREDCRSFTQRTIMLRSSITKRYRVIPDHDGRGIDRSRPPLKRETGNRKGLAGVMGMTAQIFTRVRQFTCEQTDLA